MLGILLQFYLSWCGDCHSECSGEIICVNPWKTHAWSALAPTMGLYFCSDCLCRFCIAFLAQTHKIEREGNISSVNVSTSDKFEIKAQGIQSSLDKPNIPCERTLICPALGEVQSSTSLEWRVDQVEELLWLRRIFQELWTVHAPSTG